MIPHGFESGPGAASLAHGVVDRDSVVGEEPFHAILADKEAHDPPIDVQHVGEHETVEHVTEVTVHVGGQQPGMAVRAPSNVLSAAFEVVGKGVPLSAC